MKITSVIIAGGVILGLHGALLRFWGLSSVLNLAPAMMLGLLFYSENKDQLSQ